ncbi:MAG: PAS domain-containing protein [Acidobacteria bacterium]|nr:PAS domain-containing protein [Acidobacteriota bacterium]
MTLGRSFLLWLLGVLVVTLVLVSALVLWHERQILEDELHSRAEVLGQVLALAAAEGGSPEYLTAVSMTDVRAGEVRDSNGQILWRFGPSPDEAESLDSSLMRVEQNVKVSGGLWGDEGSVDVVLMVSRARVRAHLAAAAARLLAGLGIALTLALAVGLVLVGQIVRPLNELGEWVRTFDPDRPVEPMQGGPTTEVRELARSFTGMAERLSEQRRSLVTSERRFRELFLASPTPLLRLDDRFGLRGANPAAEPYLGGPVSRMANTSLATFLEKPSANELLSALEDADEAGDTVLEAAWKLANGELAEVELHMGLETGDRKGGYLVAIHDLTDQVRRMGERWRRTFDAMMDGVALVDDGGSIVLANQALEPHQEAVSADLASRLRGEGPAQWRTSNGGRLLDCSLTSPAGLEHSILVVRDVTEAVDSESRLRDAEKMQAVGTLASGVAHDFNNLLAAILLHVRLMQRRPETAKEAVAAIGDLAEQGTEVVRELLFFARHPSSPPGTINLVDLVRQQEGVLRHLLPDDVDLVIELEDEAVPVVADPVGLRRLLVNLVINARDALEERGGRITVRVEHTAARAVLEVADDGAGIPSEAREHLFEPFFTLRRQGRGSGLGLAVVYSIVSAHDGEVDVRTSLGEGARFIVRLPLGEAAGLEPLEGRAESPALKVLLIEADGRSAAAKIEVLAGADLEVRHAPSFDQLADLTDGWTPGVAVVAEDVFGGARSDLGRLHMPVLLLGEAEGVVLDRLGPLVVRLPADASSEVVLETLTDLAE